MKGKKAIYPNNKRYIRNEKVVRVVEWKNIRGR